MATEEPACKAFKRLGDCLKQSYVSNKKLCQDGELGHIRGMYVPNPDCNDEMKPAKHTSSYLRGGVISTIATFEAFVGDLINEATDIIAGDPKYKDRKKVNKINSTMSKRCNQDKEDQLKPKGILVHQWDTSTVCPCTCDACTCKKVHRELYSLCLLTKVQKTTGMSIIDRMLKQGDILFKHKIRDGNTTRVFQIIVSATPENGKESKCFICVMLRFCYGIRNVMAHGNADRTFENDNGALKDFPTCNLCGCDATQCPTCKSFEDANTLTKIYNKYIEYLKYREKKNAEIINKFGLIMPRETLQEVQVAENRLRRLPIKEDFKHFQKLYSDDERLRKKRKMDKQEKDKIPTVHWDEIDQLLPDSIPPNDPLPAFYAYFHMLRIYYWLVESKRDMYVTYGLFERVTDFINTLAFRMNLAVKQLLVDNYEISSKRKRSHSM